MLQSRKYNLWGGEQNVFPRFPIAGFNGKKPDARTNPTLNDMKGIFFSAMDEKKVMVAGLEAGPQDAVPQQMFGVFVNDGIGNIHAKTLDYNMQMPDKSYPRRLVSLSDPMASMATWDDMVRTLPLTRANLELASDEYATHIILSMMMESPNVGMWIAFSMDGNVFYKMQSNIYNVDAKRYVEGQTICLPLAARPDSSWNETLHVRHRNMGRYILHLRGVMYRSVIP